jgi:hypothetical protein
VKRIFSGYVSLFREALGIPNDGSFLVPPANPIVLILICGIIGLIRDVLSIALRAPAFYSFQGDILLTSFAFPVQLCLLPGALLDWQLRKLGYRDLAADSIFGLSFYLQALHLIIPFVDAAGFALGIPPEYELFANSIRSEWYTNVLHMSPGILFGWWVTAYVTAKVLRKRLGIRWPAMLLAGATTYAAILIPTYFVFPALNTVFSRTFGPYLWNPLDYLFVHPKWYPFWGYGWYFTLSAVPGLIYYVRNSGMQETRDFFRMSTAGRAHVWLVCIAAARYYLDTVWSPGLRVFPWLFALLHYIVYLYMLYLFVPALAGFVLHRAFGRPLDTGSVLRESVLVWIVYPMVPIISMATRSAPLGTIEWFRYIPSFMVENNFLPVGMIAVIPVLLLFYTRLISRTSGGGWLRSFVAMLAALIVIYVLFYQYADRLLFLVLGPYGPLFAAGLYTLCFLAPLFFTAGRFHAAFGRQRIMLPHLVWAAALLSVALMAVGLLSLHGAP